MERPRSSTLAWATLVAGVTAYDYFCAPGDTMSERVDDWLEKPTTRVLALGAIGITAAHLANVLPERVDPFHRLTSLKR